MLKHNLRLLFAATLAALGVAAGCWMLETAEVSTGEDLAAILEQDRHEKESRAVALAREEHSYRVAQKAADQARQAAEQARQELDRQLDRSLRLAETARARQAAAATIRPESRATEAEGSPRAEALRQLAELEAGRASLLERLLPAHPDVQEIEAEIETARAQLSRLPPPAPEPADQVSDPAPDRDGAEREAADSLDQEVAQAAAAVAEQRRLLSQADERARRLDAAKRQAAERLLLYARDRVAHVSSPAPVAPLRSRPSRLMTLAALSVSLLAGWLARRGRPRPSAAFHDLRELEAATGVPVVGVLSAEGGKATKIAAADRPSAAA